jgi:predicted ATPase/class 3 adenylate cyclase
VATTAQPTRRPTSPATDALRPFVPRLAADWLRSAPNERARSYPGTLVFADVSGFTELTEELSRKGKAGSEEVAGVLDAAFAELVSAAYAHDADLLKWGGDAILLFFRGDEHMTRAAAGAAAMQQALTEMRRLRTSVGPVRLQMSIGAHSDLFHFFLVGSVHRELVIAGTAATTTVLTESIADAGEIALSRETADLLEPSLLGREAGEAVLLAAPPDLQPVVPPFFDPSDIDLVQLLPAEYTLELRGNPGDPEHRHVAVAFVEICDTDEMLEREGAWDFAAALEARISSIQEACLRFGVTFAQTDISKNGVKAILLAGAPRSAGGDEEELLLRTVRAIVETPERLPVRVGVESGRVFAGIIGPPTRRTYTFYGDTINTAARIMARAEHGQVLAPEEVLRRARTTYELTPVEPFAAKGKAELVQAAAVGPATGERELITTGPLVGRAAELGVMREALERARAGRGGVVVIEGDAGIGKTRLLAELRRSAGDLRAVAMQCEQIDQSRPYAAAGAILRRAMQLGPLAGDAETEERLRTAVAGRAPSLEPWLPLLGIPLGLELAATPETSRLDEKFVPERIAESVRDLLRALVPETALVVLDDAHWLDEASNDLIGQVAGDSRELHWLVVAARRRTDGGFSPPEETDVTHVQLEPLGAGEAKELVVLLTQDSPVGDHVADAIARRSGGSPLFVTELVSAVGAGANVDHLPESVEALMAAQIDVLPAGDRAALRQASVLGARFELETLLATLELDPAEGLALLQRLESFLAADEEGSVRFRHGLIREAAYEGLPFRRRAQLHRRVGAALEALDDPDALAGRLAHHFFEASDWAKAVRYGWLAGKAARDVYANEDAAALLDRALEAARRSRATRPEEVAKIAEALGDAAIALGELARARDGYRTARRRVQGDPVEAARLLYKEGRGAARLEHYAEARRVFAKALSLLDGIHSVPATAQRAKIEAHWAGLEQRLGRPLEQLAWCERAIADAEASDARDALGIALYVLDWAYLTLGQREKATYSRRAVSIFEEVGDLTSMGSALNMLGMVSYYAGRWDQALEFYEQAAAAFAQAGDRWNAAFATLNTAEILSNQGRADEAEPLLHEALRSWQAAGSTSSAAAALAELGRIEGRRGRLPVALDLLEQASASYAEAGEEDGVLDTEARAAEALLLGGDAERALTNATRTLLRCKRSESGVYVLPFLLRVIGCAHLLAGRLETGREVLHESLSTAEALSAEYELALSLDAVAGLERVVGGDGAAARRRDDLFAQLGIVVNPAPKVAA